MDLELSLSKALTRAHLMEAILHGSGAWTMSLGTWGKDAESLVVPAYRVVAFQEVSVEADFPAHCWIGPRPTVLTLFHNAEMVGIREIHHPGDGSFQVTWGFALQVLEEAA